MRISICEWANSYLVECKQLLSNTECAHYQYIQNEHAFYTEKVVVKFKKKTIMGVYTVIKTSTCISLLYLWFSDIRMKSKYQFYQNTLACVNWHTCTLRYRNIQLCQKQIIGVI